MCNIIVSLAPSTISDVTPLLTYENSKADSYQPQKRKREMSQNKFVDVGGNHLRSHCILKNRKLLTLSRKCPEMFQIYFVRLFTYVICFIQIDDGKPEIFEFPKWYVQLFFNLSCNQNNKTTVYGTIETRKQSVKN